MRLKLLLVLVIFLVTGCGNNKLVCEKKEKNAGYNYFEQYELIYNDEGNELKQINIVVKNEYNEYYTAEEIEKEYETVVEKCGFFENASDELIECESDLKNSLITINIKIKVEQLTDEMFEQMMYVTKEEISNFKDSKELLENVGYSCK